MRAFSPSTYSSLPIILSFFTVSLTLTNAQSNPNPILTSSFTWNPTCGPTVACGPSAAGYHGTGFAASNNLTYAGCTSLGDDTVDCNAASIVSGVGKGCGQCWQITPQSDWYPSNGLSVGTSVVVKINDQCTDAGYCDQTEAHPVNTGYGKEIHIDLCAESGVTGQFFGAVGPGVVVGLAQLLPDCSALDNGPYGSGLGGLDGSSSASSSSSSSSGSASSSSSGSESSSSSGSGSSSSSSSGSSSSSSSGSDSSTSSSGSSSSSGSDSSSNAASDASSSSGSDSSSNSASDSSSSSGSDSSSKAASDASSSSGSDSSSSSGSDSSSNAASDASSSSGSDSSSNSASDSSSSSGSESSSKSASDASPNSGVGSLDIASGSRGSGNWSWTGTKAAKYKLSSGHDGPKAGAPIINAGTNGGSNAEFNAAGALLSSTASQSPSTSLSVPPGLPPSPTTLVAVVISSTASEPMTSLSSDANISGQEEDDDDSSDDCDSGDTGEL